jgi:phosphoglycerol geranylgeranyltransferase
MNLLNSMQSIWSLFKCIPHPKPFYTPFSFKLIDNMVDKKVYSNLLKQLKEEAGALFLVLDPPNQDAKDAGKLAKVAQEAGAKAIAVGGSLGAQGKLLDDTLSEIKDVCSIPTILFPGNIATLSNIADAVYFMSMLNSNDPYYISGAQIASSFPVKKMGLEVIPTSYIIVEPGRAVGWVGRAQPVPRNLPYLAAATALAGQYMGSKLAILESGGGAEKPVPKEMIAATKKVIDIPLLIAGGVCTPDYAFDCISNGADIIHVGSAIEKTNGNCDLAKNKLEKMCTAVKKGAKAKQ